MVFLIRTASRTEGTDSDIDVERESYKFLRSSWVVPGIASPSERLKIDVKDVYVLPYGDNSGLDRPLEMVEDVDGVLTVQGDEGMLEGLSELEKRLVRSYATSNDLPKTTERLNLSMGEAEKMLERIAIVMEKILIERREA